MPRFQQLPVLSFSIPYVNKNTNTLQSVDIDTTTLPQASLDAAINGDLTRLKQVWQQGMDMDTSFGPGKIRLLHHSSSKGHLACVRFLVEQCKVTVDAIDREGETPLLKASYAGHFPVVRYLVLEAGASVYHQDKDGWSALHNACSHGNLAMVQLLLENSSNANLQSDMNHTPLINAASKGHLAIVQHLINTANADPFCKNKFDESAYDAAAVAGEGYICKQLERVERARMEEGGMGYQLLKQHSTIPVTIYEYQQQTTTSFMTHSSNWAAHQSKPWMTPSGEVVVKNRVSLPPLTDQQVWIWLTDWIIDYTYPTSDKEGWEYAKQLDTADDNWTKKPPTANTQPAIRRRRWIRIMTRRSTYICDEDRGTDVDEISTQFMEPQDSQSMDLEQILPLNYIYQHEEASRPTSSTSITRANAAFVSGSTVLEYEDHGNRIVPAGRTLTLERLSHHGTDRVWEKNENALDCRCCGRWFNIISRRHHCRQCGLIVCDRCSTNRAMLPYSGIIHDPQLPFDQVYKSSLQPQRICDPCFEHLARPHTTPSTPGSTTPRDFVQRANSMDSVMMYCPVCGKHLDTYGSTDEQERHVQSCLNAGFSSASLTATGYVLYQAPPDSTLLDQECSICLEEFAQGHTIARLGCLCSYHHSCIHGWFSLGKGCPVHSQ